MASKVDNFIQHAVKFTSSSSNLDKELKFFQWTLLLASKVFHSKQRAGLAKVSSDISYARYLLRFNGLPACVEAIRTGSWVCGSSKASKVLGNAMAWTMLAYYPLEHVAYLKWTSPDVMPTSVCASQFSAFACRFWFLYLVCEMLQSVVYLRELEQERRKLEKHDDERVRWKLDYYKSELPFFHTRPKQSEAVASLNNSVIYTRLQLVRSALFILPCMEWSRPSWDMHPWLDPNVLNGLMWLESVVCMYQSLR